MMSVQYFVHHMYERGWCICQSKQNDLIFVESVWCFERGLVAVIWMNPHLVVSARQVQLGEYMCSVELIQQVLDEWQRISVSVSY